MSGEDPGVAVVSMVIDTSRKLIDFILDLFKHALSGLTDILKFATFVGYRKSMLGAQSPMANLKHGEQSLAKLREHEQLPNTHIVTQEIGNRGAMRALVKELDSAAIDYAITKSGDTYSVHYKQQNESEVALAQAHAIDRRFGNESHWTNAVDRFHQDGDLGEPNARAQSSLYKNEIDSQAASETSSKHATDIQPEGAQRELGRAEQAASIDLAKAERTTSQYQPVNSVADAIKMEALRQQQPSQDISSRMGPGFIDERQTVDVAETHEAPPRSAPDATLSESKQPAERENRVLSTQAPLETLVKDAKRGAQAKNHERQEARKQHRGPRARTQNRTRSRELGFSR